VDDPVERLAVPIVATLEEEVSESLVNIHHLVREPLTVGLARLVEPLFDHVEHLKTPLERALVRLTLFVAVADRHFNREGFVDIDHLGRVAGADPAALEADGLRLLRLFGYLAHVRLL
jgi:hypothetical protein